MDVNKSAGFPTELTLGLGEGGAPRVPSLLTRGDGERGRGLLRPNLLDESSDPVRLMLPCRVLDDWDGAGEAVR